MSTWRLELSGRRPADLFDVEIVVKYSAEQGGEVFANAVKGMLKPYPAARYIDIAGEFADAWAEFTQSEDGVLTLPLTADMFEGISGTQITGVYATFETEGTARFLIDGDRNRTLEAGKLLQAPGLNVGGTPWTLVFDGDRWALGNAGLILTYRASTR